VYRIRLRRMRVEYSNAPWLNADAHVENQEKVPRGSARGRRYADYGGATCPPMNTRSDARTVLRVLLEVGANAGG
jgi:hypothetical protein